MMNVQNVFFNTQDSLQLNALLFTPEAQYANQSLVPVLIIEGSGKSNFKNMTEESPFYQLASSLAQSGCLALVYNKRGSGNNSEQGSFWKSTFNQDQQDAQSALDFLLTSSATQLAQPYIIGHSFGGPHALMLAKKNNIAGIVMLTSTIQPTELLMLQQNKVIMSLQGLGEAEISQALADLELQLSQVKNSTYVCKGSSCSVIDGVEVLDQSIQVPWLHEVLNLNFLSAAQDLPSRILFIFGNSDFIIPIEEQQFVIKNLINSSQNRNQSSDKTMKQKYKIHVIDKLDHCMVENDSKLESMKYVVKAQREMKFKTISRELVDTIVDWIQK